MKRLIYFLICFLVLSISTSLAMGSSTQKKLPSGESVQKTQQALVKQAEEWIEKGSFDKAIPLLEQASQLSADGAVKTKLITAYEGRASVLSKKGLLNEGLVLLEKADKLRALLPPSATTKSDDEAESSANREVIHVKEYVTREDGKGADEALAEGRARVLFEQAFEAYREKQYGLARSLLQDGIKYNGQNALAFELLGDIEYYSQNLDAAKEAYEKAYGLNKIDRLGQKLEKLLREEKLEAPLSEYLDEHFIIRYNRKEDLEAFDVREYLRESYRSISKDFGHYLDYKTVVILYQKQSYQAIEKIPKWSGALYDGKIRIPVYESKVDLTKLREFIQHELTHVFVTDLSKNRAPIWLQEGLAQYEENKIVPLDTRTFREAAAKGKLLSVDEIEKGIGEKDDQTKAMLFYRQAFMLATSLIEDHRFYKMKQLLGKLAKDARFEGVFESIYLISFDRFFAKWTKEMESRFK